MGKNKRFITSLLTIAAGIAVQVNAAGHFGEELQNKAFTLWPILFVFIGLDMLFSYRRLVGAVILFFTGAALIGSSTPNFPFGKDLWDLFQSNWPLLIILYGIDSVFNCNGTKKLINGGVIVSALLLLGFILFSCLKIDLPDGMVLTDIFSFINKDQSSAQPLQETFAPQSAPESKGIFTNNAKTAPSVHRIDTARPAEGPVQLEISAPAGKVSIRGADLSGRFLSGEITMNPGEEFIEDSTELNGVNLHRLSGEGTADARFAASEWNLALDSSTQTMLSLDLQQGYLKADLSNMNLISANLTNESGSMDILAPTRSLSDVVLTCYGGDVRIYYASGSGVAMTFRGTGQVNFPDDYARTGNFIQPRDYKITPIPIEVNVNGGSITILPYQ